MDRPRNLQTDNWRPSTALRTGRFLAPQRQEVLRPLDGFGDLAEQFLEVLVAVHEVNG